MTSGLVVISNAEGMCYPYLESIQSFIPLCDEIVCAFDWRSNDGTREKLEDLRTKTTNCDIRIVQTAFNIEEYGWQAYAIARTTGYQACNGDIVLMFDADGILHEKDEEKLKECIARFSEFTDKSRGYWLKNRFYSPTKYHDQKKHSGIYNKKRLGDRFDFYHSKGKGIPNLDHLTEEDRSWQFPIHLFGYEHVWDTEDVVKVKTNRYGLMIDKAHGHPTKTPEEYFETYRNKLVAKMSEKGKVMEIADQPKIIQEKLEAVNESHFGLNWFL